LRFDVLTKDDSAVQAAAACSACWMSCGRSATINVASLPAINQLAVALHHMQYMQLLHSNMSEHVYACYPHATTLQPGTSTLPAQLECMSRQQHASNMASSTLGHKTSKPKCAPVKSTNNHQICIHFSQASLQPQATCPCLAPILICTSASKMLHCMLCCIERLSLVLQPRTSTMQAGTASTGVPESSHTRM
jgi:hypothetical protein